MVTVKAYHVRTKSDDGTTFIALELEGGPELVQSQETGKFYATVRRCSISSTFDEETAKKLVGSSLPGNVVRVESDPYEYTIKSTGEIIQLAHTYKYRPEDIPVATNKVLELV